jgi:hypothetical protein
MSSNDIYTAKAVGQSATVLGYWLIAASLLHAIMHPIAMAMVAKISADMVASQMRERFENATNRRPAP